MHRVEKAVRAMIEKKKNDLIVISEFLKTKADMASAEQLNEIKKGYEHTESQINVLELVLQEAYS